MIIKLYKQIKFLVENIFRIFVGFILSCLIWRNKKYITFNASVNNGTQEQFLHNTKYLYLYMNTLKDYKLNWLCEDKRIVNKLMECGYNNVFSRRSLKGIYYALKSKYWFYDYTTVDLPKFLIYGAKIINLWHGASGLKKFGYDTNYQNPYLRMNKFQSFFYNLFIIKDDYYIVNSNYEIQCRKSAFNAQENKFILLSSPRLDALYNDIQNSNIFMEEDFNNIKIVKEKGKKIFIYMPTFRDTGKNVSEWLKSYALQNFLRHNNIVLVCKLHPADINFLNFELSEDFYKMDNNSDVHPILKYTDAMITDYSGVYFDYLHLDKPIIYHTPDLEEYEAQCRGFYRPYETLIAGAQTKTEDELINAMQNVIDGIDDYKTRRKELLDEMFVYQDGNNCKRVISWIKNLK